MEPYSKHSVRNLGIIFDTDFKLDKQINSLVKASLSKLLLTIPPSSLKSRGNGALSVVCPSDMVLNNVFCTLDFGGSKWPCMCYLSIFCSFVLPISPVTCVLLLRSHNQSSHVLKPCFNTEPDSSDSSPCFAPTANRVVAERY